MGDSDELREMSINNAKLALEQYKNMETKGDLSYTINGGWENYLAANSVTYQSLLKEIESYIKTDAEREAAIGIENIQLTDESRRGVEKLLGWLKGDKGFYMNSEYGIRSSIEMLERILESGCYSASDRKVLNTLREEYASNT